MAFDLDKELATLTNTWSEDGFEIGFPATEAAVRTALSDMRAWAWGRGLSDTVCGSVEIALAEALNNVVEHACAGLPDAEITLSARLLPNALHLTLRDPGRPLPDTTLPQGTLPPPDGPRDALPEGGFGWFLIWELTRSLTYTHDAQGNCLTMMFDLTD